MTLKEVYIHSAIPNKIYSQRKLFMDEKKFYLFFVVLFFGMVKNPLMSGEMKLKKTMMKQDGNIKPHSLPLNTVLCAKKERTKIKKKFFQEASPLTKYFNVI